jgi:hypothetical protein
MIRRELPPTVIASPVMVIIAWFFTLPPLLGDGSSVQIRYSDHLSYFSKLRSLVSCETPFQIRSIRVDIRVPAIPHRGSIR